MNVRVLVTLTACFSVTGCCMPAFLCNPALMHCPPAGAYGPQMMSPYASGPPTFRSFHNNLAAPRFHNGITAGGPARPFPAPIQRVRSVVRQRFAAVQPARQQYPPQQFVAAAPILYTPSYQPAQHQPQPPAKPWKFPWKPRTTVKDTPVHQSNYHWLPVVNNGCADGTPCGQIGYSSCASTPYISADGCGESVMEYTQLPTTTLPLSPVPAAPKSLKGRDFSAPTPAPQRLKPPEIRSIDEDRQDQRESKLGAEPLPSPPPAESKSKETPEIPEMAEPPPMDSGVSPASKPDMADPINPFDDIEDFAPESSLPVEADMPQAGLTIPAGNFRPLMIPSPNLPTVAAHANQSSSAIRQTSHHSSEWQAISLEQGFFQEDAAAHGTHQTMVEAAQEFVPVRRVITRRRQ